MDAMNTRARTVLSATCHETVLRFFAALDAGRMDEVASAFAADGVWHRQGAALRGPADVARALAARPAGRITAHLVLNFIADFDDEHNARVRYMVLTYRHDASELGQSPAPMVQPYSIAEYNDRMRRDDGDGDGDGGSWRVLERRARNVFVNR